MREFTAQERRKELVRLFEKALENIEKEGLILEFPRRNGKAKRINPALTALIAIDKQIAFLDKNYGTTDEETLPEFIDKGLAANPGALLRTSNERRSKGQSRNKKNS